MKGNGNSLAVQWLGLHTFTAEGLGSIPGQELRSHRPCGMAEKKKSRATELRKKFLSVHKQGGCMYSKTVALSISPTCKVCMVKKEFFPQESS